MGTTVQHHWGRLDATTAAEVRALAAVAEGADGVEALGEQTLLHLAGDADADSEGGSGDDADVVGGRPRVLHVTVHSGDRLVGYAQAEVPDDAPASAATGAQDAAAAGRPDAAVPSAELVVAPDVRRQGIGRALLDRVRGDVVSAGHPSPAVWAHGNLPGARALAAAAGLGVVRELWRMTRDLGADVPADPTAPAAPANPAAPAAATTPDSAPTPTLPDGVTVRAFVVGQDEGAWLAVNARAFAGHPEQGRMTLEDLRAREREPWFSPDDLLLAEDDGRLLASVWLKVEPGSDEGELYVLGVDPDAQGRGLGRLLTAATLARLAARGLRRAVLYTEATNTAAVRTYERAGFAPSRIDVQYR